MNFDRSLTPNPTKEFNFSLPEIKEFRLNNELEVLFVQKNELPIIQLKLIVNAGSKFDPQEKKGLANLTAMMVDEGDGKYSALELSDEFDILGSHFNISCGKDNIILSLQTLTENFEKSLELFSTVLTKPHFNNNDLEREKRKIITNILQIKDNPDQIADIVFDYLIFNNGNQYSSPSIGLEENIKTISIEDIKNFYKKTFSPSNSALIVVGNTSEKNLKEKLNIYFSDWDTKSAEQFFVYNTQKQNPQIYLFDKPGSVQSEIRIGHISSERNEKNYYSKLILNTILGGQFSSRINLNLREDKGYTYGALSRFSYYKNTGCFYVSTSVGAENTGNSVKEIMFELNNILNGVTQKEFEFAQSSIIRRFPSNFETYKQIASNLASKYIYNLPDDYFNNYISNIRNTSFDIINNTAKEFILTDEIVILIVGDKGKINPQLEELKFNKTIQIVNLKGEATS